MTTPTAEAADAPRYQPGAPAGNDEEAGYQPASPVEQSALHCKEEIGNSSMSHLPTAATAQSTQSTAHSAVDEIQVLIAEQRITGFTHAEIMTDTDTGQPVFCVATDQNLSDFEAVTPSRGVAAAQKLREAADRIEALANEYATKVTIPEFIERFGIYFMETLPDILGDTEPTGQVESYGWNLPDGRIGVLLADGISPVEQVAALRTIILSLQAQGSQA